MSAGAGIVPYGRVLQVAAFVGKPVGGAEESIRILSRCLRRKCSGDLLTTRKHTEFEYLGGGTGHIPVDVLVAGARVLDWYLANRIIAWVRRGEVTGLLHSQDMFTGPAAIIAAGALGLPSVVTVRDGPKRPWRHHRAVVRLLVRLHNERRAKYVKRLLERANCVIFVSQSLREEWLNAGLRPKDSAVSYSPIPDWTCKEPRADDGDCTLLTVGRLEEYKGFHLIIRALAALNEDCGVRLIIAGQGRCRQALETLAGDLGVADRVIFKGWVPHSEIRQLLEGCDVAVAATLNREPLGRLSLEAMAVGRPVIAPGEGGFSETVVHGTTGLLFESGNTGDLARSIEKLCGDRGLRLQMGRAGEEYGRARFSAEASASSVYEAYRRTLEDHVDGRSARRFPRGLLR